MMRIFPSCRWWRYAWLAAAVVQHGIATNVTESNETTEPVTEDTTEAVTTQPGTTPYDISWLLAEDCSVGHVTAGYDIYPTGVPCHSADELSLTECSTAIAELSSTCPHLPLEVGAVRTDVNADPSQGCYVRMSGSSVGATTGIYFAWGIPDGDVEKEFHAVCRFSTNYFSRDWTTEQVGVTTPYLATRAPPTGVVSGGQRGVPSLVYMVSYIMLATGLKVAGW
mmetsp:Transcript_55090/g.128937  ORF Transcript_55090/g.128937 Transcript_55090/m.128937 type:complete len:224 (+) Transcript_55090:36-707(+)